MLIEQICAYLLSINKDPKLGGYVVAQTGDQPEVIDFWDVNLLGTQPTQDQLNSVYTAYQTQLTNEAQAAAEAKSSAIAKLITLGLTEDEIKALLK